MADTQPADEGTLGGNGAVRGKDPEALDEPDEQVDTDASPPVNPSAGGGRQHDLHRAGKDVEEGLRSNPAGPGSPAAGGGSSATA